MNKSISFSIAASLLLASTPAFAADVSPADLISAYGAYLDTASDTSNTVTHFDKKTNLTPRIIDKSIKARVELIYASDLNQGSKKRNLEQLTNHCKGALTRAFLGAFASHCDLK